MTFGEGRVFSTSPSTDNLCSSSHPAEPAGCIARSGGVALWLRQSLLPEGLGHVTPRPGQTSQEDVIGCSPTAWSQTKRTHTNRRFVCGILLQAQNAATDQRVGNLSRHDALPAIATISRHNRREATRTHQQRAYRKSQRTPEKHQPLDTRHSATSWIRHRTNNAPRHHTRNRRTTREDPKSSGHARHQTHSTATRDGRRAMMSIAREWRELLDATQLNEAKVVNRSRLRKRHDSTGVACATSSRSTRTYCRSSTSGKRA